MSHLRCIVLLQFTTALAVGQLAEKSQPASVPKQTEAMVRSLYREVVARHLLGIPRGADMRVFAPYLSKSLLQRIDVAIACSEDEARQHPDPNMKPEIVWLETGLFSGDVERTAPDSFHIERTQAEKDGSFRVYVRLRREPIPLIWRVAVVVVRENGRFVVDEVTYLKDEIQDEELSLSELLTIGCDGPRWVGRRKH